MSSIRIKICGITNLDDALYAVACGADTLGFVFYDKSPRCVSPDQARKIIEKLPPFVTTVGLFVNETADHIRKVMTTARLNLVQLHGDETPEDCIIEPFRVIKALRVRDEASLAGSENYPVAALLLDAWSVDAYGGTGQQFDWELVQRLNVKLPVILAGGLTPDNVALAVRTVRPYAVDVSSGVEAEPGRKDHSKLKDFIEQVRNS